MLDVTLRELEYVAAVAHERNFTRAAARLHMAQPALSQAIRRVERRIGVQLFERTSRRVATTPAGESLAFDAADVLAATRRAVTRAQRAGGAQATLRVHVVEPSLLAPRKIVATMRARMPEAAIHQTTLPHEDVVDQLVDGSLAFAIGDRLRRAGVHNVQLSTEPIGVLMSSAHPLADRTVLSLAELTRHPLVSIDEAMNPWDRYVRSLFETEGLTPLWSRTVVFGSIAGADILRDDETLLVSLASIGDALTDGLVWRPLDPPHEVGWFLNWSSSTEATAAGRYALDTVLDTYHPDVVRDFERLDGPTPG